ncbi:hypothetical protein [Streptomyces sp. NPDC056242]|uniref:hypothetical protein n=1 Tax=Streptomyces sp. NPDC056242 TaxID=3345760 RepID=UPI0035D91E85
MSTSSQTQPPKGVNRIQAERFARRAQYLEDPTSALVEAQLATAHATLALLDGLNAHRLKVLSDAASFLESKGEAGPGYLLRTCYVPSSEEKDTREGESTPELTAYRASHDSITFGLYVTADAARARCESYMRREQPTATDLNWIEDEKEEEGEEDGVAELVATIDGFECVTGYIVTRLTIASKFDEEADE